MFSSWPWLQRTRSGAPRRFFLYADRAYAGWWSLVYNLLLAGLIPLAFIASCAESGLEAVRPLRDPQGAINRFRRAPSPDELRQGLRRGAGRLRAADGKAAGPVLCHVSQKELRANNRKPAREAIGWQGTVERGVVLELAGGERLRLVKDIPFVATQQLEARRCTPEEEAAWRSLRPDIPAGGWLEQACVEPDAEAFAEGCVSAGTAPEQTLGPCGTTPPTLWVGEHARRSLLRASAGSIEYGLAVLFWLLFLAGLYGWKVSRVRPFAQGLIKRLGPSTPDGRWLLAAAFGLCVLGICAASLLRPCAVLAVACSGAAVLWRIRSLGATLRAVGALPTTPLGSLAPGPLKVQVRVPESVAPRDAPLSAAPCAAFRVEVYEILSKSTRSGAVPIAEPRGQDLWHGLLPVADASGQALVNLAHGELDLRSVRTTLVRPALGPVARRARALLEKLRLSPASRHSAWVLEELQVAPGEELLVFGEATTATAGEGARPAGAAPPRFVHRDACPLVVHAGNERSLTRHLRSEQLYLVAMLAALLAGLGLVIAASLRVQALAGS